MMGEDHAFFSTSIIKQFRRAHSLLVNSGEPNKHTTTVTDTVDCRRRGGKQDHHHVIF